MEHLVNHSDDTDQGVARDVVGDLVIELMT